MKSEAGIGQDRLPLGPGSRRRVGSQLKGKAHSSALLQTRSGSAGPTWRSPTTTTIGVTLAAGRMRCGPGLERPRYDAAVTHNGPPMPATGDQRGNSPIKLAVIPGDGIGPEVVAEGLKVLSAVAGPGAVATTQYDLGAARWQRTGEVLPDSVLAELAESDAILFGAVGVAPGATDVPSGLLERGLLLKLRFAFDHYVNLRPSRLFPGVPTPLAEDVVAGKEI